MDLGRVTYNSSTINRLCFVAVRAENIGESMAVGAFFFVLVVEYISSINALCLWMIESLVMVLRLGNTPRLEQNDRNGVVFFHFCVDG